MRRRGQAKHATISPSGARDLATFAEIDIRLGRGDFIRSSRFYFHETKHRPIVGDNINLRVDDRAARVAANRRAEVRHDNAITFALKVLNCQRLAAPAQGEMWSDSDRFGD